MALKFLSITLELVATTNKVYFGGIFLSGFCAGGFGTLSMTYIGEISPQRLRGVLTAAAPISMTLGSLIASLIINFTGDQESRWAYRTAFASEFSFAGFATLFLPFIPESPWWLAGKGKDDKALNSLENLGYSLLQAEHQLGVVKRTLSKAKEETKEPLISNVSEDPTCGALLSHLCLWRYMLSVVSLSLRHIAHITSNWLAIVRKRASICRSFKVSSH